MLSFIQNVGPGQKCVRACMLKVVGFPSSQNPARFLALLEYNAGYRPWWLLPVVRSARPESEDRPALT